MVGVTGVEPVTLRLSSACSNQLSYTPARFMAGRTAIRAISLAWPQPWRIIVIRQFAQRKLVELRRFELLTYSLQSYRSTN